METISHYRILSRLGAGGMGEVYLAEDPRLGRRVALKVLTAAASASRESLRRFGQEARSVSALNHPNILTIYEIGADGDTHYIATEFVDGVTLREHTAQSRMKLHEVLDIAIQIASALAAAHAAGIIHRDIKPENIMLRRDGYLKVLDFGIAKLSEQPPSSATDADAQTMMMNTRPGVVIGTVAYMSPEQAQGSPVDARTDVWSLGCVLYELVTGRLPFEGPTASHIIVALLEREPPSFAARGARAPEELERIVTKALTKERDERYQTMRDMLVDLRRLNKRLEVEAELDRSVLPERRGEEIRPDATSAGEQNATLIQSLATREETVAPDTTPAQKTASAATTTQTGRVAAAQHTDGAPHPTSSLEYLVGGIRSHRRRAVMIGAALFVIAAGLTLALYRSLPSGVSPVPFGSIKITRLTTTGKVTDAAISPDGKYVVHVISDGGRQSLWVRQVAATGNVQIVPPADVQYRGVTFSPDGDYIYYTVREAGDLAGALYQVPALGGVPRKLVAGVDRPATFAPGGKRIAFVRNNFPGQGERSLMIANADGSNEQRLAAANLPTNFWSPAWSPDGATVACAAVGTEGGLHVKVIGVRVADGLVSSITSERWFDVGRLRWLKDGSGLLLTATGQWTGFSNQVWHISYPGGEARRITSDLSDYSGLSLTADSKAFVAVQAERHSDIWVAQAVAPQQPGGARTFDLSRATQITRGAGKYDGYYDLSWTPDGRIVYGSTAGGSDDIWIMDADGANQRQLTENAGINLFPSVSPDGRRVVFASTRDEGNTNIWRMETDGGEPVRLTSGSIDNFPRFSPDGRWVIYMSNVAGLRTLWKVPAEGGAPVRLTDKLSSRPVVSPDGKLIACYYMSEVSNAKLKIVLLDFDGGRPVKELNIPVTGSTTIPDPLRWSADGRALLYVLTRGGVSNIWSQPVDGGDPVPLTNFASDRIFSFDLSADGGRLACARGNESSDVVLVTEAK